MTALNQLLHPLPHATKDAPIGIFDSGVGGLSIAQEIAQYLPNERIIYFADTAHVPYGPRSDEDIRALTARAIDWLYRQGCKVAVVACNTASAFSLDGLRDYYGNSFPIIGLVPALKPAVIHSKTKTVAVLATPATFRGQLLQDVMQRFALPAEVKVLNLTCLDLVPYVEAGLQMSDECLATLQNVLQPALEQNADYLVLGCTHYPFLKPAIEYLFGHKMTLIDSGLAVARQTARILIKNELLYERNRQNIAQIQCFVSGGNAVKLQPIVKRLMNNTITWDINNVELT